MLSTYNDKNSFAMAYNIYADKLLGTNIVPQSVYDLTQNYVTTFARRYFSLIKVALTKFSSEPFGVVLDSRQLTNTKSG
jgi:hypothetical protein